MIIVSFREYEGINNHTIGTYCAQDKHHPFFSIDGHPLYSTDSQAYPATPRQEAFLEVRYYSLPAEKECRKRALLNDSRHILHALDGEQSAVQV